MVNDCYQIVTASVATFRAVWRLLGPRATKKVLYMYCFSTLLNKNLAFITTVQKYQGDAQIHFQAIFSLNGNK